MSLPPGAMESGSDVDPPTATDARATLDPLALDRAHLADRVVAPGWYNPAGAVLFGVFVLAQYVDGFGRFALQGAFWLGLAWLGRAYRKNLGVVYYGWSWPLLGYAAGFGLIEVGCLKVAREAGEGGLPGWSVGVAVAVAVITLLLLAPRADAMARATLRKAP